METITRELQHAKWRYDFDRHELHLTVMMDSAVGDPQPVTIVIGKTYTYSLGRFLIRVWQKLAQRPRKPKRLTNAEGVPTKPSIIESVPPSGKPGTPLPFSEQSDFNKTKG